MTKLNTKNCSGPCCKGESQQIKFALMALEKMSDMFGVGLSTLADSSCRPTNVPCGCAVDSNCRMATCPYRNVPPQMLQIFRRMGDGEEDDLDYGSKLSKQSKQVTTRGIFDYKVPPSRSHRKASQLRPGEVGLYNDRAAIDMGHHVDRSVPLLEDGQPTGAVYYNMRPDATMQWTGKPEVKIQRRHVMQALPPVPKSAVSVVGPVTGLPIGDNEHMFVFRLGKRQDEPDEMARLQIEMRVPKREPIERKDADTQFLLSDVHVGGKKKNAKNNKDLKNKKGSKNKKVSKNKKGSKIKKGSKKAKK